MRFNLNRLRQSLVDLFPHEVIATENVTPAQILGQLLSERELTVSCAESCTGGTMAQRITAIAGCSDVFRGSVVSYCNEVKATVLGVSEADLREHGAVSREVVEQMAQGAIRILGCDCAVATSGIAGPGGATPGKPVGTVWIAATTPTRTESRLLHLPGNRSRVIDRAATEAMLLLASII